MHGHQRCLLHPILLTFLTTQAMLQAFPICASIIKLQSNASNTPCMMRPLKECISSTSSVNFNGLSIQLQQSTGSWFVLPSAGSNLTNGASYPSSSMNGYHYKIIIMSSSALQVSMVVLPVIRDPKPQHTHF